MNEMKALLERTPFIIKQKGLVKTQIYLNNEPHIEVNNNMVEDMLTLLNGAYKTGIIETFGLIGFDK